MLGTLNSTQNVGQIGTSWSAPSNKYLAVTSCGDSYCGCKTGFTVINTTSSSVGLANVKRCDGTTVTIDIPASGSVTVSDCINMNSFWSVVSLNGLIGNISIAPGTYNDCV